MVTDLQGFVAVADLNFWTLQEEGTLRTMADALRTNSVLFTLDFSGE
jgi:hypothetical protein